MRINHRDEFDRRVHATLEDDRELVRYERAGKWWIEKADGKRRPVSLSEAVAVAAESHAGRGQIHYGLPGGLRFDKMAREAVDAVYARRRSA